MGQDCREQWSPSGLIAPGCGAEQIRSTYTYLYTGKGFRVWLDPAFSSFRLRMPRSCTSTAIQPPTKCHSMARFRSVQVPQQGVSTFSPRFQKSGAEEANTRPARTDSASLPRAHICVTSKHVAWASMTPTQAFRAGDNFLGRDLALIAGRRDHLAPHHRFGSLAVARMRVECACRPSPGEGWLSTPRRTHRFSPSSSVCSVAGNERMVSESRASSSIKN